MTLRGYDAWKLAAPPEPRVEEHTVSVSVTLHFDLDGIEADPSDPHFAVHRYLRDEWLPTLRAVLTGTGRVSSNLPLTGPIAPGVLADWEYEIAHVEDRRP